MLSTANITMQFGPKPLFENISVKFGEGNRYGLIGVCSTLFDEVCKGCGRTATEVSNWVFLSDEEKHAVWVRIEQDGTAMRFKNDKL